MKRFFALALALCFSLCGCKEEPTAPAKAPVKTVALGFVMGDEGQRFMINKDADGRVSERVSADGSTRTAFEYSDEGVYISVYGKDNVLLSENYCTPDKGTVYTETFKDDAHKKYSYENGAVVEETTYKNKVPNVTVIYNDKGKQEKNIAYDAAGAVRSYTLYTYDDSGRNTRTETYNSADMLQSTTVNEYNEKGYYASVTVSDGKGLVTQRTENVYNDNGTQTGKNVYKYENGVAVSYEKWVADETGKLVLEGTYDA